MDRRERQGGSSGPDGRLAALRAVAPDVAVALCAGGAGVAGSYAVAGATRAFVAAPVDTLLALTMPGVVVTFAVTVLGDLGQQVNLLAAVGLTAVGMGLVAYTARIVAEHLRARRPVPPWLPVGPGLTAVGVGGLALAVTGAPLPAGGAGVAAGAVAGLPGAASAVAARAGDGGTDEVDDTSGESTDTAASARADRRGVLAALLGLVGTSIGGGVAGSRGERAADGPVDAGATELLAEADAKSLGVSGLEPLVSESFYEVDINSVDPDLAREEWSLTITGAVEEEIELDYAALTDRPSREEFVTLRCVGEPLNGRKMDTALWTVVDVAPLLDAAGAGEECCVMARAVDGYYEEFPRAALADAMLAYRMNGRPLPRGHGAPVRLLVPGHWGEINVKWIDEIEVLTEPAEGYWEERGWHGTGPVNTVAKLHAQNRLDDGRIEVGGHAYAGIRGIERVEVSTDGGATWTAADLSDPLPGDDVWRQWRHAYAPDGPHEVVVRAVDGTGAVQPSERADAFPSGATGWVSREIEP
jgi:DMSO/TMAO reductase YedYZ molybdopterin-dependent catalytic subunit